MSEACHCQSIHNQIRKYQQCHDDGRSFILTKGDVKANIKFPINWNQRQCLCCFRETKNYESYNNIIQMVMVTSIRLIQNLGDSDKILSHKDDFSKSGSTASFEEEDNKEADQAVWTMSELEHLLTFINSSLVMTFPLYIVCKHNHICTTEEMSSQETSILASYCNLTDPDSLSVMLLRNVCFFCDSGGSQAIKKLFEEPCKRLTISLLTHIVHCLANLKHWLTPGAVDTYISPIKPSLVRYICSMSDDDLRQAGGKGVTEVVMSLIKENNPIKALFDKEYLKLSFKYFSSSVLKIRLAGLQQLNSQVALFSEAMSVQDGEQLIAAGLLLAEWLVTSRIIEHIFGPNLHNELVKQSQLVLHFLGNEGKITVEHIDIMWAAALQKHCSRQVLEVLTLLVKHLTSSPLVHLMDLLAALLPHQHTEQTLTLVHSITKRLWSMQTQEEKKGNKGNADTSAENEISVCSTDEESEDSTDSDDVVELPERPNRAHPGAPGALEDNPVQMAYTIKQRGIKHSMPESIELETSSPTQLHVIPPPMTTSDSDVSPVKLADEHMAISPDSEMISPNLPTLPVTVAALESASVGECKRIQTPPSSHNGSNKSVKNMADFDGEEFMSDDELSKIEELNQAKHGPHSPRSPHSPPHSPRWSGGRSMPFHEELNISISDQISAAAKYLDVPRITEKGHTILWDLIQEETAVLLPDGMAAEAEKLLNMLLCIFDMSASIKLQFIQACISNIESHRSSTVSLRLLPKLITSFQQPYRGREVHTTTLYIEETFGMMNVFFNNMKWFGENLRSPDYPARSVYGVKTDIAVRLQFLSFIYSYIASPEHFCLSKQQVDIIWDSLANSTCMDTRDHVLSWFNTQINSNEFHALSRDMYKYLYYEKLTLLELRDMTMVGFNLFHHLHEMLSACSTADDAEGHDKQLWDVALQSQCTEVSLAAIDYLNNCYMSDQDLSREPEFVDRCMQCIMAAIENLNDSKPETPMQVIDRGLYLLKNHMESFRQQYAFQLRCCHLRGGGVISHQPLAEEKTTQLLKLTLSSPALRNPRGPSSPHKATIEVMSSMLLGELRAEITSWWNKLVRIQRQQDQPPDGSGDTSATGNLNDTHIRLLTAGSELKTDMDKKSLQSLQLKDNQILLVSGTRQRTRQEVQLHLVPHLIPMMILVQRPHFDNLFWMLEQLCNIHKILPESTADPHMVCGRARVLSRRVWDLLMMVPTNPSILESVSKLSDQQNSLDWSQLLDSRQPSKLIYSLQVVESLSKGDRSHKPNLMIISDNDNIPITPDLQQQSSRETELVWSRKFVTDGGLLHLFELLVSRKLEENQPWNDWDQDAFSYLLKLLGQFSILSMKDGDRASTSEEGVQRSASQGRRHPSPKPSIPRLNTSMLELINARYSEIFNIIHSVIYESVLPPSNASFPPWGRFEVLHQTMIFLIFWAYSDDKVLNSLHNSADPAFHSWLKRLTLEAPEAQLRQEGCKSLYKLCLGQPSKGSPYAIITLSALLELLPIAVSMEPLMIEANEPADSRKAKLGASCQDYLWLTGQILESMDDASAKQFDLNGLTEKLRGYIAERQFYEQRHLSVEDEGLIGLLNLLTIVIKRNDSYKSSDAAKQLLSEIFDDLFLLPCIVRRHLPKCKSNTSRCSAYDLLVELVKASPDNYRFLHSKLVGQHDRTASYPWDYWPMEDVRSASGFVGLQNLGATCYMATCMQHLYMIPQARQRLLSANCGDVYPPYAETLKEIQKMFAYLMESERKSYNPKDFCKVYEMDRQPLNTGEQKDMTEFFTDLITKLEDMSPDLKSFVKDLFGGVISNNVMSMECPHFSTRPEEFYTVRCQVVDMKTLYESLDELCVKDTLDGDNMYNCSQCSNKVRAEKRACFKHLPKMLCFNTMRYTFNMVAMQKEKINTHFSFPHTLDMAPYLESNLLKTDKLRSGEDAQDSLSIEEDNESENTEYELIGITVHTGTADGGHYYSFIKDKMSAEPAKYDSWFLFNDSEVKSFDSSQLAQECFGGEMTSTTYDTIADKFMDFSFERTNSAYMLFYKRIDVDKEVKPVVSPVSDTDSLSQQRFQFDMSKELSDWIWKDNTAFLRDKNIFCHNYFGFMWQMCAYIPTTLPKTDLSVRVLPAQLSTMFLLETFIHAKEKPTMVQWIELLTKQFNQCHDACEWLLDKMSSDDHWSKQILIGCSNQMIRQMFQRLLIHVITQLRIRHFATNEGEATWLPCGEEAQQNVVARFICKQLQILQQPDIELSSCKFLSEYFSFLFEFARMGAEEKRFLRENNCISIMITFYVGEPEKRSSNSSQSGGSSDEEEEVMTVMVDERFKLSCLERMIHLVAILVESSRIESTLEISASDMDLLVGGRGMPFLMNQIKDNINAKQTCNLIFSLCRWNDQLAVAIVDLILACAVRSRSPITSQAYLKVLTMIAEMANSPPGHPPFTDLILHNFWRVCEKKPHQFLEWMSNLVSRNATAHHFMLDNLELWVEKYLLISSQSKVRTWAMLLLTSLVPSQAFRTFARAGNSDKFNSPDQGVRAQMGPEAVEVMRTIYSYLLDLMPSAKKFADITKYGVMQLVSYLSFLSLCLVSKAEKLMFSPYFNHLWQMFQPKMTDPQVSINQNKQALLLFWYHACLDCPENIALITSNSNVTRNIAFNYILADHDDADVVSYNRCMLPPYYGILKLCCQRSRSFTRQLAQHQNLMWAFQHILPYPSQYPVAVDELLAIMQMFVTTHPDSPLEEEQAICAFKKKILAMYLHTLNSRTDWQTLLTILKIVLLTEEDQFIWVLMSGLSVLSEAFGYIHGMYHEATACHVLTDISDCLHLIKSLLSVTLDREDQAAEQHTIPMFDGSERHVTLESVLKSWDNEGFLLKNCITLLNSYSPTEVRIYCIEVLKKLTRLSPETVIKQIVPLLLQQHVTFQSVESPATQCCLEGPYYPTRATSRGALSANISVRPPQPQFGMLLRQSMVSGHKSQDAAYAQALSEFYMPYHLFVDFMVRVAVNKDCLSDDLVNLSALVAYEGVPLNSCYFAKLWCEIYQAQKPDKDFVQRLCSSSHMIDYMESILHDHRGSLNNQHILQFFNIYFKMVHRLVLCEDTTPEGVPLTTAIVQNLQQLVHMVDVPSSIQALHTVIHRANADLRALLLIYKYAPPTEYDAYIMGSLAKLKNLCIEYKKRLGLQVAELVAVQKAAAASLASAEDNQKVPEMSSKGEEADHQVPSKKRRVSPLHPTQEDDDVVQEQVPKLTIEYRPVSSAGNTASKGQNRTGVDKGKALAKKSPRQHARVVIKSSDVQQAELDHSDTSENDELTNRSSSSNDQRTSEGEMQTATTPAAHHVDHVAGNNEAILRARKKMELADNVLDSIGSVLSVIEFLETDDE